MEAQLQAPAMQKFDPKMITVKNVFCAIRSGNSRQQRILKSLECDYGENCEEADTCQVVGVSYDQALSNNIYHGMIECGSRSFKCTGTQDFCESCCAEWPLVPLTLLDPSSHLLA